MDTPGAALVSDDDASVRLLVRELLVRDGWQVAEARCPEEARTLIEQRPFGFILVDQGPRDAGAVGLLRSLREDGIGVPVVVASAMPTLPRAVEALGVGAADYLVKPLDARSLLKAARRARSGALRGQWSYLWRAIETRYGFANVLSTGDVVRDCYITGARVASSTASILIEGKTGTGKEFLARSIHYMSDRRDGPFVPVNCGAIPEALVESELFGHEKGAFTSATTAKRGICEEADGGTLFLDEVGELSLAAQVKLLRFLQERSVSRLGGLKPVEVNVRIIAATNCDLPAAMRRQAFREDLYYRLAVVPMSLPCLKDRRGDIGLFTKHFLRRLRQENGSGPTDVSPEALQKLQEHDWPGNLRELYNVTHRAALLAYGDTVQPQHVTLTPRIPAEVAASTEGIQLETATAPNLPSLRRMLEYTNHDGSAASRVPGMSPGDLHDKVEQYRLAV